MQAWTIAGSARSMHLKTLICRTNGSFPTCTHDDCKCEPLGLIRGPTVLDRDRSNKPRGRTRTEVFERTGTMVLKSRINP